MPSPHPALPVHGLAQYTNGTITTTSDNAHRKLRRRGWSVSAAQQLEQCPASWAARPFIPETTTPFAINQLGTGAHLTLEHFYQHAPNQRTPETLSRLTDAVTLATWANPTHTDWHTNTNSGPDLTQLAGIHPDLATTVGDATPTGWGQFDHLDDLLHLATTLTTTDTPELTNNLQRLCNPTNPHTRLALNQWRHAIHFLAAGDLTLEDPTQIQVYATELTVHALTLPNGVPANGAIDRTDLLPDGNYAIRDYKGGRYRPHNPRFQRRDSKADQVRIYAQIVATKLNIPRPTDGKLHFIGARTTQPIDLSDAAIDDSLDWFNTQWRRYQTFHQQNQFPAQPETAGALCGWCPLANLCPVANLKNPKARTNATRLHTATQLGIPILTTPRIGHHTSTPPPLEQPMTTTAIPEGKIWEETVTGPDGNQHLNPNSYAAIRVFGLQTLAWSHLKTHTHNPTGPAIEAFAGLLADIVLTAEATLNQHASFQYGLNTRITGILRESLDHFPYPAGATATELTTWRNSTLARVITLARAALNLWHTAGTIPTDTLITTLVNADLQPRPF